MEKNKEIFEDFPIGKAVWKLALPTMTAMLVMVIYNLADTFFIGIFQGAQPLCGYSYGAKNVERLKGTVKYCIKVSVIIGIVDMILFLLGSDEIIRGFINDDTVVAYGSKMLKILTSTAPIVGILFVLMSAQQATGKAKPSLILSISRQGLIFIPAVIVANTYFGLDGLMWAQPIADLVSVILSIIMFLNVIKKVQNDSI